MVKNINLNFKNGDETLVKCWIFCENACAVHSLRPSHKETYLAMTGLRLKYDGTRAETRFRISAKWTSPFKSAGASVQSTTGSRGVRIIGSNAGYTIFFFYICGSEHHAL